MTNKEQFWLGFTILCFSFSAFWIGIFIGATRQLKDPVSAPIVAMGSSDTIAYINNEREKRGLLKLVENPILNKVAKIKACDMEKRNYFEHEDPDGRMPWHLYTENGYQYAYAGENLAVGAVGNNDFMQSLMDSPEHLDNILSPNYTDVGVANCGYYYAQEFGSK